MTKRVVAHLIVCAFLSLVLLASVGAPSAEAEGAAGRVVSCVGDSITAGYPWTFGGASYPSRLQYILDSNQGGGKFNVVNNG